MVLAEQGFDRVDECFRNENVLLGCGEDILIAHLRLQEIFSDMQTPALKVLVCLLFGLLMQEGLLMLVLEVLLSGGSNDRKDFSKGRVASGAALRVRWRVDDGVKGPFTIVLLSEWMKDDVDHSELAVSRVDDIIHSALFLARVRFVFGSRFHNMVKHMLVYIS